jgi:hypothetical protein
VPRKSTVVEPPRLGSARKHVYPEYRHVLSRALIHLLRRDVLIGSGSLFRMRVFRVHRGGRVVLRPNQGRKEERKYQQKNGFFHIHISQMGETLHLWCSKKPEGWVRKSEENVRALFIYRAGYMGI